MYKIPGRVIAIFIFYTGSALASIFMPPLLIYFIYKRRRDGKPVLRLVLPLLILLALGSFYLVVTINYAYSPSGKSLVDRFHNFAQSRYQNAQEQMAAADRLGDVAKELKDYKSCLEHAKDKVDREACSNGMSPVAIQTVLSGEIVSYPSTLYPESIRNSYLTKACVTEVGPGIKISRSWSDEQVLTFCLCLTMSLSGSENFPKLVAELAKGTSYDKATEKFPVSPDSSGEKCEAMYQ